MDKEFGRIIYDKLSLSPPVAREKNWYKAFILSEPEMGQIMKMDFTEFKGWEVCKEHRSLGSETGYRIDGTKDDIIVNHKKGSDEYSAISIYLNRTKKVLILYYGVTYGM